MTSIIESFSHIQLRNRLREQGITAADLSRMIKVSNTAVSNWVNGKTKPNPESLHAICTALETQPQDFTSAYQEEAPESPTVATVLDAAKQQIAKLTGMPIDTIKVRLEINAN